MAKKQGVKVFTYWQSALQETHPREDYSLYDARAGAFAVADGVGLYEGIEYRGRYPRVSGSYRIAHAFCNGFVSYFRGKPNGMLLGGFRAGNAAAKAVNRGRSRYDVIERHRCPHAATAAMAVIRKDILEWGRLCDAGVAVISKRGAVKLNKSECSFYVPFRGTVDQGTSLSWILFLRTIARNAVGPGGKLLGYGVVTGEKEAEQYLERGKQRLFPGDAVLLYTDGFAPYVTLPQFRRIVAGVIDARELQKQLHKLVEKRSAPFRKALHGHRLSKRASSDVIEKKLAHILGPHIRLAIWSKEKTLIVVRPVGV